LTLAVCSKDIASKAKCSHVCALLSISPTRPRAGPRTQHGKSITSGLLHKTAVAGAFQKEDLDVRSASKPLQASMPGPIAIFGSSSGTGRKAKNSLGQHRDAPFAEYDRSRSCSVGILSPLTHFPCVSRIRWFASIA
jgi:hypothetical protein